MKRALIPDGVKTQRQRNAAARQLLQAWGWPTSLGMKKKRGHSSSRL